MDHEPTIAVPEATLTRWAETCLHMNHLGTLIQRELQAGNYVRAQHLAERARTRAWTMLNELFSSGAKKPDGYAEAGG